MNGPWVEVSGGKGHDDGVVVALAGTRDRGGAESRFVSFFFMSGLERLRLNMTFWP